MSIERGIPSRAREIARTTLMGMSSHLEQTIPLQGLGYGGILLGVHRISQGDLKAGAASLVGGAILQGVDYVSSYRKGKILRIVFRR